MLKISLVCFIAGFIALTIPPWRESYSAPPPVVKEVKAPVKLSTEELIVKYSNKYDVSAAVMRKVIDCESQYRNIQSLVPSKTGPNGREDSWGISQIHLPSHTYVTKEQALNKEFAISFMAKNLAKNRGDMWTCWRQLYT